MINWLRNLYLRLTGTRKVAPGKMATLEELFYEDEKRKTGPPPLRQNPGYSQATRCTATRWKPMQTGTTHKTVATPMTWTYTIKSRPSRETYKK